MTDCTAIGLAVPLHGLRPLVMRVQHVKGGAGQFWLDMGHLDALG